MRTCSFDCNVRVLTAIAIAYLSFAWLIASTASAFTIPASTADTSTTAAAHHQQLQQLPAVPLQQQLFQPLPLLAPSPMRTTAPLSILTTGGNSISGSSSAASSSYGGSGVASVVAEYGSEGSRSRASTPEPIDISTRPFFVTVAQ
eukprot:2075-Heterococcus_DN1.PRE.1